MTEEQQQQQQQPLIHRAVVDSISSLAHPSYREERHKLRVRGHHYEPIDRRSVQYFVDFLDTRHRNSHHEVVPPPCINVAGARTLSTLNPSPDGGGLDVLTGFFARALTKVKLWSCDFGNAPETSRLLAAIKTNRTVVDLEIIGHVANLENCRAWKFSFCHTAKHAAVAKAQAAMHLTCFFVIRAFLPALRANRTLKRLNLFDCWL
jgi:hypothetical protein